MSAFLLVTFKECLFGKNPGGLGEGGGVRFVQLKVNLHKKTQYLLDLSFTTL